MISINIPFSGFYNSLHSGEVDREIEREIDYFSEETGCDVPESFADLLWQSPNYSDVYLNYAKAYCASFCEWLGLHGEFEEMTSPREYNFATDRIFAKFTRADIARMWKGIDKAEFSKLCRERFTSYDGFISHYSADWKTWGRLSTWDHNQLGTLLLLFAETEHGGEFDQWAEFELCEDMNCNGDISNWLCESDKYCRVLNAMDYLKTRCKRQIRTMAQWHAARRMENRPFTETPLGEAMS